MPENKQRLSPGRELELPIRVSGMDFEGKDFVEDATTLTVSRRGAEIRLRHKLILEDEIRILSVGNNREARFRVVTQAGEATSEFCVWGVECLEPDKNVLEGGLPGPSAPVGSTSSPRLDSKQSSQDKSPGQVVLRCSQCGMRELVDLDEAQTQAMRKLKGLVRYCPACGATGLWKRVAGQGA